MTIGLERYTRDKADVWNEFVASSKNGTFLLDRKFMDYHSDRFCDCSVMFYDKRKLVAVLPASYDGVSGIGYSHQGLTYGGLIMDRCITQEKVNACFELLLDYYRSLGIRQIVYKPIPYIYCNYPSDEDLYALFVNKAQLKARGISQCIALSNAIRITESRKCGLRKAVSAGVEVRSSSDYAGFWTILDEVLSTLHATHPVHSPEEMELLESRFPDRIKLYGAFSGSGEMLAGAWVFDMGNVVHTQYLASSSEGKSTGALDILIDSLIRTYSDRKYLDFGISTEDGGNVFNSGLAFQKEGFGGRGICYDVYTLDL